MQETEKKRLETVRRFLETEFSKEKELQEIVVLAAKICGTPTALITLIDDKTQHIKFRQSFDLETNSRQDAFCQYVINGDGIVVVPDATQDDRFVNNPLVLQNPNIRFYAGAPLTSKDGYKLGSLCIIDQKPGEMNDLQKEMLGALAKQSAQLMEFDFTLGLLKTQYEDAKRAEIELKSFFESSIDHHLLLGAEFEILAFNKAWESHVRQSFRGNLTRGQQMTKYLHVDNVDEFYKDYSRALKGTAVFDERQLRQNNGEKTWHMIKFEPALNDSGEIIGVSVNSSDVTKKVEQEQLVMTKNNTLNEIAFVQSHELRRPVASIMGLMSLLKMDGHCENVHEWKLLEAAVKELDDKIKSIVGRID